MKGRVLAASFAVALLAAVPARASVLIDPYDNILAPDGLYALFYANYTHAGQLQDAGGGKAADADFDAWVGIARPIGYFHVGPVPMAFQAIVPFGRVSATIDDFGVDESSSGIGDVTVGPGVFLYTNETSGTYLSYWFYATAPTGKWDEDKAINLGTHHWYFEHQLAVFQQLGKAVLDANFNYYHHNEEPDNEVKAPPRFEVAVSAAYPVTEQLFVGAHAGAYWDLKGPEFSGEEDEDLKARKFAAGPTVTYQITEKIGSTLRWTHDLSAANDFKGDDVWLRLNYSF